MLIYIKKSSLIEIWYNLNRTWDFAIWIKIVNFILFHLEWLVYLVQVQKVEQTRTESILFKISAYFENSSWNFPVPFWLYHFVPVK